MTAVLPENVIPVQTGASSGELAEMPETAVLGPDEVLSTHRVRALTRSLQQVTQQIVDMPGGILGIACFIAMTIQQTASAVVHRHSSRVLPLASGTATQYTFVQVAEE